MVGGGGSRGGCRTEKSLTVRDMCIKFVKLAYSRCDPSVHNLDIIIPVFVQHATHFVQIGHLFRFEL